MNVKKAILISIALILLQGCSSGINTRFVPPAEMGDPLVGIGMTKSSGTISVTSSDELETKEGKAVAYSILSLISFGNAGSAKAAQNGNIDIIKESGVDIYRVRALGFLLYTRHTTVVIGK